MSTGSDRGAKLPTIRECAHRICVERPIANFGSTNWLDLPCPVCCFMQGVKGVRTGAGSPLWVPIRAFGPSPRGTFEKGCWFYTYRKEP